EYEQYRHKQAIMIDSTRTDLNHQVERLQEKKDEKKELLASEEDQKKELSKEKEEQQKALAKLQGKEKELKKQIAEKQKAAKKLDDEIHKVIAEEMKKQTVKKTSHGNKGSEITLTPEAKALSNTFERNKGILPWPVVEGVIYKPFGEYTPIPAMPDIKEFNDGVDIATSKNAIARVVFEGTVTTITEMPMLGKIVIVKHGEYFTVYANLKDVFVKTGDKLTTKGTIGTILFNENDGKTDLHLELWKGNAKQNPEEWLSKRS